MRPPVEVFAFLADPTNESRFIPGLEVTRTSPDPYGVGSTYHLRWRIGEKVVENDEVCIAFDPPRRMAHRLARGSAWGSYALEPSPDGTLLTYHFEGQFPAVPARAFEHWRTRHESDRRQWLNSLKALLESAPR
jgi:carbon monoxide dehydrogenase subunit G